MVRLISGYSKIQNIETSVPQGSMLYPFLCNIYKLNFQRHNTYPSLLTYSDDIVKLSSYDTLRTSLNQINKLTT